MSNATKPELRSFQDILTDLQSGEVHDQCTDALRKVVLAVQTTKQTGGLTIDLKVKAVGNMISLVPTIKQKIPQPKTEATAFFSNKVGDLSLSDHRQLDLKTVETKTPTPLRSVAPAPEVK